MKRLLCLLGILYSLTLSAQTTDRVTTNNDPPIYNDVSGSPYLVDSWNEGFIRFSSGRVASQFKIKFDCINNKVVLQFNGSTFHTESKVRDFVIYTKSGGNRDSMVFRKGFPVTDKANEETFYEILEDGKSTLLCLHFKQISEETQFASKVIYRRIKDETQYYLLQNGKMTDLPMDKLIIVQQFPAEHQEAIRKYIGDQQLKFNRGNEDFEKLVRYYNSL